MIQFFQNFKSLYYFQLSILMAARNETEVIRNKEEANFQELIQFSKFYSKFSNGVSLFVTKILCFEILLDSFNMFMLQNINLVDPHTLFTMFFGSLILLFLTALDLRSADAFVKFFLGRVRLYFNQKINEPNFEPPMKELANDLTTMCYLNHILLLHIPTLFIIYLSFFLFGRNGTDILLYGSFVWILVTAYPNLIKAELLMDCENQWGQEIVLSKYAGVNPLYVRDLTAMIGNINKNYGHDPQIKVMLLAVAS